MRILCDVVLEACSVENACRELSVERHGAYSLVDRGVPFPGLSRKRTGIDRSHWNLQERPARNRRWRNGARAGCAGPGRTQAGLDASSGRGIMPGMDQPLNSEKDIPMREDIRLLGRILGDTVRSQEGDAVFDIIEGIRQSSIRFRRDEDQVARRELEAALNRLSRDETIQIIRAFSYFSHLANIAEDQHHI